MIFIEMATRFYADTVIGMLSEVETEHESEGSMYGKEMDLKMTKRTVVIMKGMII